MNHQQIRQSFLDFFQSKSHQIVSSAPVVPQGDSSLIFTNAGMNQFKNIFLGSRKDYPSRVANTQKCIRVSGKHNDLEEVGVDTYHHTFFEMLGNWSFGDYYKKEAIEWAWELLTKEWKLPIDKLYITVYQTDDKTAELWAEIPDLAKNRILRFGEKDNFWEMGDTGPCGPCSEIHMDLGDEACDYQGSSEHICEVNGDCSRYMEIWNLVFIQYNRNLQGQLEDLVNKHVDTGMGFERICSILQNKKSNYDTDIFTPIIDEISRISGKKYRKNTEQIAMRVIADHLRAVAFSIADGVVPSNEGRGYVIRRILRRAYRYGRNLDLKGPFIYRLVPVLVREMGDYFTELKQKEDYLIKLIETEEKAFHKTLDKGLNLLEQFIAKIKQAKKNNLSGKDAFVLYDTYGFPFDLTQLILKEQGLKADENSFHREMEKQKNRSRKTDDKEMSWLYQVLVKKYPFTQYLGEEQIECKTQVQSIIYRGQELENLATTDDATLSEVILIFNQTVFYAESGGQIGDVGEILDETDNLMGLVTTTKKQEQLFLHHCQIFTSIKVGQKVKLKIINEKRNDIRKNHSATHLLHRVLGDILGNHIQQAGSLVTAEKLRFDFNHFEAMKQEQIEQVEDQVNDFIFSNLPVTISEMSIDEAKKKGAKAFFEEKYGEVVRVIDIGGESIELCGGSHVKKTGEIGLFKIVQEGSSASGIRRIEAITGRAAQADFRMMKQVTRELQKTTSLANVKKIPEKVLQIQAEVKKLQKELFTFQSKELREKLNSMSSEEITGKTKKIQFFNAILTEADIKSLREIINQRIQQTDKSIIFVGVRQEKKCVLLCAVHKNLTAKIKAGDIIHQAAHICGGGGGGRSDFAQAGGKHPQKIPIAIKKVKEMILNI